MEACPWSCLQTHAFQSKQTLLAHKGRGRRDLSQQLPGTEGGCLGKALVGAAAKRVSLWGRATTLEQAGWETSAILFVHSVCGFS